MTEATRKYTPIWKILKEKKVARITAPKAFHNRIIRAVIKEKDLDILFKYECSERNSRMKLAYKKEQTVITFYLNETSLINLL